MNLAFFPTISTRLSTVNKYNRLIQGTFSSFIHKKKNKLIFFLSGANFELRFIYNIRIQKVTNMPTPIALMFGGQSPEHEISIRS
ncbi:MAG: hypothetical protein KDD63_18415, partial [Bacteroidetes bacterium]|nr:hypothetical protein [Bacteroidota bacterium]